MPELPEVEVTMRGVSPALKGSVIKSVFKGEKKLRIPLSDDLYQLKDAKVLSLKRRGKYIIVTTTKGSIIVHLGMSGHLKVVDNDAPFILHDHFALSLDNGKDVRLNDPRRFGLVAYVKEGDDPLASPVLKNLGPEPFSDAFNADYLYNALKKRHIAVKQAIMDSKVVVGVGNIYASESLFLAEISPLRSASTITREECVKLVDVIRKLLQESIKKGGTTIRDFSGADGKPGYFVQNLNVYGHEGEKCPRCGHPILGTVQGQRHTYFCGHCQH